MNISGLLKKVGLVGFVTAILGFIAANGTGSILVIVVLVLITVILYVVYNVLTGKLISSSAHEKLREEKDKELARNIEQNDKLVALKQEVIDTLGKTIESSQASVKELTETNKLLADKYGSLTVHITESIHDLLLEVEKNRKNEKGR